MGVASEVVHIFRGNRGPQHFWEQNHRSDPHRATHRFNVLTGSTVIRGVCLCESGQHCTVYQFRARAGLNERITSWSRRAALSGPESVKTIAGTRTMSPQARESHKTTSGYIANSRHVTRDKYSSRTQECFYWTTARLLRKQEDGAYASKQVSKRKHLFTKQHNSERPPSWISIFGHNLGVHPNFCTKFGNRTENQQRLSRNHVFENPRWRTAAILNFDCGQHW